MNLDDFPQIDDETLVLVIRKMLKEHADESDQLRLIWRDAIRRLKALHGTAKTTEISEMSRSSIINVKGRPRPRSDQWPFDVQD